MARTPSGRPRRKEEPEATTVATASRSFARSGASPSPRATSAASRASSRGVETFSSPRRAASRSIISRRRRVFPSDRESRRRLTASRPTRRISRLVASLSDQRIIRTARSRHVRLRRSPSSCSTPPPETRGSGGRVTSVQIEAPVLRLAVELVEHGRLDRGRRGEELVGTQLDDAAAREVLDVHAQDAVEAGVDGLDLRAQLADELGRLGCELGGRRARATQSQTAPTARVRRACAWTAHGCFHALSYLTMPVGPITRPRTSRR